MSYKLGSSYGMTKCYQKCMRRVQYIGVSDVIVFQNTITCLTHRTRINQDNLTFTDALSTVVDRRPVQSDTLTFADTTNVRAVRQCSIADALVFANTLVKQSTKTRSTADSLVFANTLSVTRIVTFRANAQIVFPIGVGTVTVDVYNLLGLLNSHFTLSVNAGATYKVLLSTLLSGLLVIGGSILSQRIVITYTL